MGRWFYNPADISDTMQSVVSEAIDSENKTLLNTAIDTMHKYNLSILARKTWLLVDLVTFIIMASVFGVVIFQLLKIIGAV